MPALQRKVALRASLAAWEMARAAAWSLALAAAGCSMAGRPVAAPGPVGGPGAAAHASQPGAPSAEELRLLGLLNDYRAASHLPPVALSISLSKVARLHATDLAAQRLAGSCSLHSWSSAGPWRSCCYDPSRPDLQCMWNKPRELTRYEGAGFEIVYRYSAGVRPAAALRSWQASPIHNALLLNLGRWRDLEWKSVGIGIDGDYATVWWGEEIDPAGYWR